VKQSTRNASTERIVTLDKRDPQAIGEALQQLKLLYPDKSAAERADLLESGISFPFSSNGKQ
jgi:lipoate synthase